MIEGFSMGGRGSTHLATRHPDRFGSLLNQSGNVYHVSDVSKAPSFHLGSDPERLKVNDPYPNLIKNLAFIKANLRMQVACGAADPEHLTTVREFHNVLTTAGHERLLGATQNPPGPSPLPGPAPFHEESPLQNRDKAL